MLAHYLIEKGGQTIEIGTTRYDTLVTAFVDCRRPHRQGHRGDLHLRVKSRIAEARSLGAVDADIDLAEALADQIVREEQQKTGTLSVLYSAIKD